MLLTYGIDVFAGRWHNCFFQPVSRSSLVSCHYALVAVVSQRPKITQAYEDFAQASNNFF